ncbi:MAG TPA: DUF362 domain-containing protein [Phycisphaerae bacterium]|nr:DUF362 domain-containing protein [Phycisphaerae bacterium]
MPGQTTRRRFLVQAGAGAAGIALGGACGSGRAGDTGAKSPARVVIARDDKLAAGAVGEHAALLRRMLDAAMQKVTDVADAATAWRDMIPPKARVGIKVNTLGLSTQPAVVDAIVSGLRQAGVPAENIVIWDRFDVELARAGFKLNKSAGGVKCRGTDAEHYGSGYQDDIQTSGRIGSCYSRIVAEDVDTLISVPVLKDHNLSGVSLGLKNFFGAIHNPNKYHDDNCDPYIVDVVMHRFIRPKWKLTICDATRAQYHAGPTRHADYSWPFGGLIVSTDVVAADAVAADLLEQQRRKMGRKPLDREGRPPRHITTAAARGLGVADSGLIQRIEV